MFLNGLRIEKFLDRTAKSEETGGDTAGYRESLKEAISNLW